MGCCLMALTMLIVSADPKNDLKALDGAWAPASADFGGVPFPDEILKSMKLVIKNGEYTVTVGKLIDQGTLKIDSSKSPRQMDITGTAGPNKGKTLLAVFEQDGDNLKICYDLEGKDRPKEFAAKPKTQQLLVIYKRVKE